MKWAGHVARIARKEVHTRFFWVNLRDRNNLGDPGVDGRIILTLILLTWRIWWAPNNASRWRIGFNWTFKGLKWFFKNCGLIWLRIGTGGGHLGMR